MEEGWRDRASALRIDRILYDVEHTGGDVRRICDLFGVNIETALRYSSTVLSARSARDEPLD